MTRKERMLNYLQAHRNITTLEAVLELGNCSPRKTISELRRDGHKIIDATITGKNRDGKPVHWKRYTLVDEKES